MDPKLLMISVLYFNLSENVGKMVCNWDTFAQKVDNYLSASILPMGTFCLWFIMYIMFIPM